MKRHYLFNSILLLFFFFPVVIPAGAQIVYALQEGFESGIPSAWSQEHVFGNTGWIPEQGGTYPDGVAEGSTRVVLRNNTQQTQGFVTRLVSPVLDLSQVYQPILVFSHAQEHYLGDVDELRIYYRMSAQDPWVLMKEYTDCIPDWTLDTVRLVTPTSTYQIAFEGTDKYGRGIVLDDIRIRPMPTCSQPVIQGATDATSNSFNLIWRAGFDTDSCAVRISRTVLTDIEEATGFVLDTVVRDVFTCPVVGLDVNATYYCYVKAYCSGEGSAWSGVYSYRTKSTAALPYSQTFDREYNAGYLTREDTWTWMNSWMEKEDNYSPYINSNTFESSRGNYSRNATTCVVFSGGNSTTTAIPAGQWAYIVSPELTGIDLRTVQVTFWGTAYTYVGDDYASSLIVGIMTDADDLSTFVPVDTAVISSSKTFEEFIIPFDKYAGSGKYVAFVSRFNKQNLFYLDDVLIELIPDCQKITGVRTRNTLPTSTEITWDKAVTASAYNVLIASKPIPDPSQAAAEDIIYTAQVQANSCQVPVNTLEGWTKYYVYVQAVCGQGTGEWSNERTFRTPCEGNIPMYYTFEPDHDGVYQNGSYSDEIISNCLYAKSQYYNLPYNREDSWDNGYAFEGTYYLYIPGYPDSKAYVAFPAVNDLSNVRMTFFGKTYYSSDAGTLIEIGVMSDIDDYSTFVSLESLAIQAEYEHYLVDFSKYAGTGKNIAIVLSSQNSGFNISICIDNLLIDEIPECVYPINQAVVPNETTAQFTWDSSGEGNRYRLLVADISIPDSLRDKPVSEIEIALDVTGITVIDTIVNANSCEVGGLSYNKTKYYYYIQSVCDNDESNWTYEKSFETLCLGHNSLPFKEDFESYTGGSTIREIPICWETTFMGSYSYNPYIHNSTYDDYAYSGSKSLCLSSSTSYLTRSDYVALPGMDAASASELQVSFMLRFEGSSSYVLEVGILSDLADTATFVPVKTFVSGKDYATWKELVVTFEGYQGDGKYIMFRVPGGKYQSVYIDDVEVNYIQSCLKPQNLRAREITDHSAVLYWDKGLDETQWDLMVLTVNGAVPEEAPDSAVVFHDAVAGNPFLLDQNLMSNTPYYYYLRSVCGTDTTGWTLDYGSFKTVCAEKTIEVMGVETFEDGVTGFDCWETGVLTGTTSAPYIISNNGSKRLHFSNTTSSDGTYAIMPAIDIDSIARLQVTFDAYSTNTTATNQKSIIVGIITSSNDFASFIAVDTIRLEALNEFDKKFTVRFNEYMGDHNGDYGKRVMFFSSFGLETTTNYIYLDNVRFDTISSCPEPTKVWADSIGTYGARIAWNGDTGSSYRVVLSKSSLTESQLNSIIDNDENIVYDHTVSGVSAEIPDLDMLSTYYVYIQNVCSDTEKGPWSNEYYFTTECPESYPLPYSEGFDTYGTGTGVRPECWTAYYNSSYYSTNYPNCNSSYNNTSGGKASLYIYTGNTTGYYCMAVSPRLEIDSISKYQLTFDVLQASAITQYPKLIVGLTHNPDDLTLTGFLPVDTICVPIDQQNPVTKTWYNYQYDFSYLASHDSVTLYKHLVFVMDREINRGNATSTEGYSGDLYLDNVGVEPALPCLKPQAVKLSGRTDSSFVASWEELGTAITWNVQYGESGFELGSGTVLPADTTAVEITGLNLNTAYEVYVQADCGDIDGVSVWAGPYKITTLSQAVSTYPYVCGFEDENENVNYRMEQGEAVNRWHIGNAIAKEGQKSLYISNDNGQTPAYDISSAGAVWASRIFKMPAGFYSVSFDWTCYGEESYSGTTYDYIRAGFLPADATFEASSTATQGVVTGPDGTKTTMAGTAAGTPPGWLGLEGDGMYKLNQVTAPTPTEIDWRKQTVDIVVTDDMPEYYNLVFYWRNDGSGGNYPNPSAVIDNIEITRHTCPSPRNIVLDEVTDSSAKLSWEELGTAITWNVQYGESGFELGSGTVLPADTTAVEITGLNLNTAYEVYVQADCGDIDGVSVWAGPYKITTLSQAVSTYPYVCGFEDENENVNYRMEQGEAVNLWHIGNAIAKEGQKSLYISNDNGQTPAYDISSAGAVWASRIFKMSAGVYSVSFDWTCYGEESLYGSTTYDYLRAGFLPADATFEASSTATQGVVTEPDGTKTTMAGTAAGTPSGWLGLEGDGMYKLNQVTAPTPTEIDWRKQTVDIVITGDMPEYYNLVFYWRNNGSGGNYPNPSAVIDNIEITRHTCPSPRNIVLDEVTDSSAKLSWEELGIAIMWNVQYGESGFELGSGTVLLADTTAVEITGLNLNTAYEVYVQADCGDIDGVSVWTGPYKITTLSQAVSTYPYVCGFEDENENVNYRMEQGEAVNLWHIGNAIAKEGQKSLYISNDNGQTPAYDISSAGAVWASRIFKMPAGFYSVSFDWTCYGESTFDFIRAGFLPADATFEASSTTTQGVVTGPDGTRTTMAGTAAGTPPSWLGLEGEGVYKLNVVAAPTPTDIDWRKQTVDIVITGDMPEYYNLVFYWRNDGSGGNYPNPSAVIDNIEITRQSCPPPKDLNISDISSYSATISWQLNTGGDTGTGWLVRVASDAGMQNVVSENTVSVHAPYLINNLSPATKYYAAVKQFCGDDQESKWSRAIEFSTLYALPFEESFDSITYCPEGWSRYTYKFDQDTVYTKNMTTNTTTATTSGWARTTNEYGLSGGHQVITVYSDYYYDIRHWLMTPAIEIPVADNVLLIFDLALTTYNSPLPISGDDLNGSDDRFAVVVSEDGGASWNVADKTEWNNQGTGDYVYNDISPGGEKVSVDLSGYGGKTIKVGFYAESTVKNAKTDLHIDNIRINRFVKVDAADEICSGSDYRGYGFYIPYDELRAGENSFVRTRLSNDASVADSIVSLALTVFEMQEEYISGSTCEGKVYTEKGFLAERSGTYKRKLISTTTGCDSVAILNLSVTPAARVSFSETICQGQSYRFNGVEYNRAGIYTDTLISKVTGCDSIVTLQLKLNDALRHELNATICYGQTYIFGIRELSVSGTYIDTLETGTGCDSIVTLKLVAKPELRTFVEAVTCPDEYYTGHGFDGIPPVAGDYTRTEKTPDGGCDSTVVLRLTVLDNDTVRDEMKIFPKDLPYTFHGKTYESGTPVGTYADTTYVSSGSGDCQSVLISILIIEDNSGLWFITVDELSIVPTVIDRWESVRITYDSGSQTIIEVEVYDMTGRRVYDHPLSVDPVEIKAFPGTGVYLIKAVTSAGAVRYGRVIVK